MGASRKKASSDRHVLQTCRRSSWLIAGGVDLRLKLQGDAAEVDVQVVRLYTSVV